jgi:hypothetical protein
MLRRKMGVHVEGKKAKIGKQKENEEKERRRWSYELTNVRISSDLERAQLTHISHHHLPSLSSLFLYVSIQFIHTTTSWPSWWKCTSSRSMRIDKDPWFNIDLGRYIGRHSISRQCSLARTSTVRKIIV